MSRIVQVLVAPGVGGYYCEDLTALQANRTPVEDRYSAPSTTPGFRRAREVAEVVSVGLVLDDGRVAWGDCVAVAYSGKAGRAPLFRAAAGVESIRRVVAPFLQGRKLHRFREIAAEIDGLSETVEEERPIPQPEPEALESPSRRALFTTPARLWRNAQGEGQTPTEHVSVQRPLHTAVRYGVSQALLLAVAMDRNLTMAEVIADEWDLPHPDTPIPIHAQSGGERYHNADKMIVRRIASLPHALVDDIPAQLGQRGDKLTQYIRWLNQRIRQLGGVDYRPTIHLDVHGALGQIWGNNLGKVLGELHALEAAARPYPLRIECPVMLESREAQIQAFKTLREYVRFRQMKVQLVADEWANTLEDILAFIQAQAADMIQVKMPDLGSVHNAVEAVLACRAGGVGAFLGGSCIETELSARVSVHLALATRPDMLMAKPGMGVDTAVMLAQNEMGRTLVWIRERGRQGDRETRPKSEERRNA